MYYAVEMQSSNGLFGLVQRRVQIARNACISSSETENTHTVETLIMHKVIMHNSHNA